jgi:thioredoxin-like negative regulator of GroEL
MFIKKFILISLLIVSGLYSQDEEVGNEEFYKEIAQGISVVYFNAEWNNTNCIIDTLETIKDYEQSTLYYVDIDNNLELKEEYRAKRIPMVILFQDGQIIKKWKGSLRNILDLDPEEIKEEIDELLEDTY